MIKRRNPLSARVGVFAVAHAKYWEQFEGLEDTLMGFHSDLVKMIEENGVEVVDFGMIDSSEKAFAAVDTILGAGVDLLFCNMITYATSSVFAPILRGVDKPMVLVALQPRPALDYATANTRAQLENDNICSLPEFTGVAERMGKKINDVIIGRLYDDEKSRAAIGEWCAIAKVLHDLRGARFGLMGHVLEAMYDMHTDPTAVTRTFGVHVPLLEIDDVIERYMAVTPAEIAAKRDLILSEFDTPTPVSDPLTRKLTDEDLEEAARTAVALDRLVADKHLSGLAYYYGGMPGSTAAKVASSFIVGNSLLNAEGIPMCGEYDIKTLIAMFLMDRLEIGGSFAEFHPIDFAEDFILVGHDGPHHIGIAKGKPVLRSLVRYHGKPGAGASVEFKIREGGITMLGITQKVDGSFKFVIGEGYSKEGPIPPTGNTNTRGVFAPSAAEYLKKWVLEGPTHHFALGVGHKAETLRKIADALGVESVIVK